MNNLYFPPVISSSRLTRSILLSFLAFVVLTLILPVDADARTRSRTIGGTSTDLHDHGIRVQCTWPVFEGAWSSDPVDVSVSHSAGDPSLGEYATCSGWNIADGVKYIVPVGEGEDPMYTYDPLPGYLVYHGGAPWGQGKFLFDVTYTSETITTCVDDDSGIGNDCVKFTDDDNKGNGGKKKDSGSGGGVDTGATFACQNTFPGTVLTYQYYCEDGVDVTGYLTLVPSLDGGTTTQQAPDFTGPCGPLRVEEGDCTMQLGGVPSEWVKIKGTPTLVVDAQACLEAFPQASVPNALNSGQTQNLEAGAMLFYEEVSYEGNCDTLSTHVGSPTVAHGRYCQSDISNFWTPVYVDDPPVGDGFDNQLRVCEMSDNPPPHTGDQDVEIVELADITAVYGPTLNLNCTTGGNTDSGKYKVSLSDQATLLVGNIDITPLSDAPKLEGASPIKAVIDTDSLGVDTLVLTYPTCDVLSNSVAGRDPAPTNNSTVTLELIGQTDSATTIIDQTFKALLEEVKVNGL